MDTLRETSTHLSTSKSGVKANFTRFLFLAIPGILLFSRSGLKVLYRSSLIKLSTKNNGKLNVPLTSTRALKPFIPFSVIPYSRH